ncbi:elicitor-responsive protein 1-like [Henckelia pumila]|uniref:elicitor-responsive protein 1-like n=1 Tax=Henckelia pumila TaxID=405737 RepID=UPI003C6E8BC5
MTIGTMEVTLVGARDLKNTDCFGGKIDPYVLVQYQDQEQKSCTVRGHGNHPVLWNEKFRFKVEFPNKGNEHEHPKLVFKLMDRCIFFTPDGFLGQATIYLKEMFEIGMEDGKAEMGTHKYRVISANQTYHGEIKVGITFTTKEDTDHKQ